MSFVEQVGQFISRHRLIEPGQRVLVGVSGGPDSVALLHVLLSWDRQCAAGCEFHVAHLDHGIRGQASVADARWVAELAELAERLALPCHVGRADVPGLASARGGSIEATARHERYRFLAATARDTGCVRVALGHHADDQVETVLARLLRGTGLRGLAGMPVRRTLPGGPTGCEIVRPLLGVWRADVLRFLDQQGQTYRTDATNADVAYQRNWIRHELVPVLEQHAGPGVRGRLYRLADQSQQMHAYLDACVGGLLGGAGAETGPQRWVVARDVVRHAHEAVVGALVWSAMGALGGALGDLTYDKVSEWVGAIGGEGEHGSADLPGGVRLVWDPDTVRFERAGSVSRSQAPGSARVSFRHELIVPGATAVPEAHVTIEARVDPHDPAWFATFLADKGPDEEAFDWGEVQPPLCVRSVRPGDRLDVLGLGGTKKVQDILVDAKLARDRRARVPLVCDARGPLWLAGLRRSDRARVTGRCRQTLVLRVRWDAGGPAAASRRG